MNDIKYVLIVSQYYYSHHCFVVSAAEDGYREKALSLIEKLEDYKRNDERPYHYGTLFRENAYTEISGRWNVNDAGDIYFIPCKSVAEALQKAEEFNSELNKTQWLKGRGLKAAQRKIIEKNIDEHHLYSRISKIIGECFTVL
jgi:hypothetical protein